LKTVAPLIFEFLIFLLYLSLFVGSCVAPVRYIIYFCHVFPQHGRRTELRVLGRPAGPGTRDRPYALQACTGLSFSLLLPLGSRPGLLPSLPLRNGFSAGRSGHGHRRLSSESGGRMIRVGHRGSAMGVRVRVGTRAVCQWLACRAGSESVATARISDPCR
jgi:hypothetical protein